MPSQNSHFHLRVPHDPTASDSETSSPDSKSSSNTGLGKVTSANGTFPFLKPTVAHFHIGGHKLDWNSRDHRKGRHPVEYGERRRISTFLRIEWWNISWWVAVLFTLGSAVWVVNGFFVFMPSLNVDQTNNVVGGWTAFVGGSIFEVGSYLMILEALNRKHAVPRPQLTMIDGRYVSGTQLEVYSAPIATEVGKVPEDKAEQQWIWFGTRWHELGFVACAIQLFGATIFWISTVTGIPNVIDMDNVALVDGIFWVPQVIGGSGFIISRSFPTHNICNWDSVDDSLMFMFEVQPNWYHIRPFNSLGWHVGFWNLVGAVGFTLCGAFGIAQAQPWALFQSGCSTFWGGWAFLIGSICQWIECLNR